MSARREFRVDCAPGELRCALTGVMRLESVEAYRSVLAEVEAVLRAMPALTLDLTRLAFLNSSGVRALARLVLAARHSGKPLTIVATSRYPWQAKAVASLHAIHPGLAVELRAAEPEEL
jgi:hypothetical protein